VRVFLTGGTGFFGLHLLRALSAAGHAVTALAREASRVPRLPGVTALVGDLCAPQAWRAHLGGHQACVHNGLVWGAPEDDLELYDVRASAQLFAAAADAGVARAIYTSSTAVHRPWSGTMSASDAPRGVDLYGAAKLSGEAHLWAACAGSTMRGTVVRPGPIVDAPATPGAALKLDRRIRALVAPLLHLPTPQGGSLGTIARALTEDPADDRTLESWAAALATTPRTLARRFLAETGLSFGRWRQQHRLLTALELLGAGHNVTYVALAVGYHDVSSFIARFKAATGVTPARYFAP
jgi:AraC-like DNA-binding protein